MRQIDLRLAKKPPTIIVFFLLFGFVNCYSQTNEGNLANDFWKELHYGGSFGLNLGSGYTEISVSPSAIYPLNNYISVGTGLIGSYTRLKNQYTSTIYGVSAISLFNPIEKIQLSVELEQIKVNTKYLLIANTFTENYWNTGLYFGAGYRNGNVTLGARYNLLFDKDKSIYNDALMPFIRFYF
jgi:hypothetical protein